MAELNRIRIDRTAHYYSLGEKNETTKQVWFVIHGYGQLAEFFVKRFQPLADRGDLVIAPEGLSKYYLANASGRVGASWMTKAYREDEIQDHIDYLNRLYDSIQVELGQRNLKINVLGFSQGVSTVFRWLAKGHVKTENIIFWSGRLPNEDLSNGVKPGKTHFIYGKSDEYLELMEEDIQKVILERNFPDHIIDTFEGKHEILAEQFAAFAEKYKW